MTRDGGRAWRDVTPPGPTGGEFYTITASPSNVGSAYAALARYRLGDLRPHLFKTSDYGATWSTVSDGLPQSTYARVLREDPVSSNLLFAGTNMAYLCLSTGSDVAKSCSSTLPTVSVTGIVVAGKAADDLVISTEGSGLWALSGLTTLRQIARQAPTRVHLFAPAPAYQIEGTPAATVETTLSRASAAPRPAVREHHGAPIDIFVPDSELRTPGIVLQIIDPDGHVLTNLLPSNQILAGESVELRAGLNRIYWNLRRSATAVRVEGCVRWRTRDRPSPRGHVYRAIECRQRHAAAAAQSRVESDESGSGCGGGRRKTCGAPADRDDLSRRG